MASQKLFTTICKWGLLFDTAGSYLIQLVKVVNRNNALKYQAEIFDKNTHLYIISLFLLNKSNFWNFLYVYSHF